MLFQRRHYIAIAAVLTESNARRFTVSCFSRMLEDDNPNFDQDRFLSACLGLPKEQEAHD